jgi:CubicO group peptidase (beta-lactamase class C family)
VKTHHGWEEMDAYVVEQMARLKIPGAALVIVEGDRIVHRRGFGRARPGGEVPTSQTPFFIGSLVKSITALAVMQLVEAGRVELDAPVWRYLPWFRVADPEASAEMTVRHLLHQTSGLPTLAGELALVDFDDRPGAAERQVRALATLKINRPVGSRWAYSNLNYTLLGLIIEAVSGESYLEYIQTHILDPLEMTRTTASRAVARRDGLARGHRHWFGFPVPAPDLPIPHGSLAAGQLISTAEDLAHYIIAHLNGGRYREAQVLSAAGMDELHRGVAEFRAGDLAEGKYGMGWFETDQGGTTIFSHAGNVPDYSAFMALVPALGRGVVVLLNADPFGLPPITDEVGSGIAALLAGGQPDPIRLDIVRWIMRSLPAIPLLQIAGVLATRRRLARWRRDPAGRPGGVGLWGRHLLLPLIPNLTLATALVALRAGGLLRFMAVFMPDLAWIIRISGGLAALWAVLRTGLVLQHTRVSNKRKEGTNR